MAQFEDSLYFDPQQPISYWRKNLPHWGQEGKIQFVSFRLNDSLPQSIVKEYRTLKTNFLREHPHPWSEDITKQYRDLISNPIEKYVDRGYGSCVLADPQVRKILVDAIEYFDKDRYFLWAYVIMPNHVHVLITLASGNEVKEVFGNLMRYAARGINKQIGRRGQLWQEEPFDTLIRNVEHYANCVEYIKKNPRNLPQGSYTFGGIEFQSDVYMP